MAERRSNGVNMTEHIASQRMQPLHRFRLITAVALRGDMLEVLVKYICVLISEGDSNASKMVFNQLIKIYILIFIRNSVAPNDFIRLSDDLIRDILSRLRGKCLMRCRAVSRAWNSLISSPDFINIHLDRSLSNSQRPDSLFISYNDYCKQRNYSEVRHTLLLSLNQEIEQTGNFLADRPNRIELRNIYHKMKLNFLSLVGSSNGLLCLANPTFSNESGLCVVWNPSIQKVHFLPKPDIEVCGSINHSFGFGYEPGTHDYKLVRLVYRLNTDAPLVEIYKRQTGSWQSITAGSPPYLMETWSSSVFVNGAVHWAAHTPRCQGGFRNVILSFNMKDENFDIMDMPQSLQRPEDLTVSVALHDGLLALVCNKAVPVEVAPNKFRMKVSLTVWVMKDYARVESWTKVFDVLTEFDMNRVIGFTKSGEVLVNKIGRLYSLRPGCEKCVDLPIAVTDNTYLDTYVESLVMPNVAESLVMPNVEDQVPGRQGKTSSSLTKPVFVNCLQFIFENKDRLFSDS